MIGTLLFVGLGACRVQFYVEWARMTIEAGMFKFAAWGSSHRLQVSVGLNLVKKFLDCYLDVAQGLWQVALTPRKPPNTGWMFLEAQTPLSKSFHNQIQAVQPSSKYSAY